MTYSNDLANVIAWLLKVDP